MINKEKSFSVPFSYAEKNFKTIWVSHSSITYSVSYKYLMLAFKRYDFVARENAWGGLSSDNPYTHFALIQIDDDYVFTMISCISPISLSSIILGPISLKDNKENERRVLELMANNNISRKDYMVREAPSKYGSAWRDNCILSPEIWAEKKKGFKHRMLNRMRRVERLLDIEVRPFAGEDVYLVDKFTNEWLSWENHAIYSKIDNFESEAVYTRNCIKTMYRPQLMLFRYKKTGQIIGYELWSTPLQGVSTVNLGKSLYGDILKQYVTDEADYKILDSSLARFAYYYHTEYLYNNKDYKYDLLVYGGYLFQGRELKFGTLKDRFCKRYWQNLRKLEL